MPAKTKKQQEIGQGENLEESKILPSSVDPAVEEKPITAEKPPKKKRASSKNPKSKGTTG